MAERSPDDAKMSKNFNHSRSKTLVLRTKHIQSLTEQSLGSYSKLSVSLSNHSSLKTASSCPKDFHYLSPDSIENSNITTEGQPPSISDGRNNSETDSSLREDISQLSAKAAVVYTLTESLEKLFDDRVACGSHDLFSPTSQQMCTFRIPSTRRPSCQQIEDSDFNSDISTSREASPFNISDSCSSMSASNSDFSSTEQKDSKPQARKAKESWLKVRRMIMWSPFVQIYRKKYPWIQLAGHHGSFRQGVEAGTILKKLAMPERIALEKLNEDPFLEGFVPKFSGVQTINGEEYIQMQDLLRDFDNPSLMDIKIGLRTFHEEEIVHARYKTKWRKDLYEKMCAVDPKAPTDEENELTAISKYRYMAFRESQTSTVDLGFRIEGIKNTEGVSKDFKTMKDKDKIIDCIFEFSRFDQTLLATYISRLKELLIRLQQSPFIEKNQLIGSSLLFVHSNGAITNKANLWMIDFGKTIPVPPRIKINHKSEWKPGNYEDVKQSSFTRIQQQEESKLKKGEMDSEPPITI
ncbi:Inositol-trisphosphate 3-kinase B isoform X1 [Oopsacas minuta]|uniref:Kinase n=1 Tax=Oopsacas minuta TaxID=111878 RepID=A0AAV7K970_9METZ|nr:Inositol-trisphosphate 3-kinase B isoform X1 [Oopsacas minuta]